MRETQTSPVGQYAPDFELPSVDGEVYHLTRYRENYQALGIVFMGNNCPFVQLYIDRLQQLQRDFAEQGFTLIGINANA
ncbi:MAG: redoxin domain-containing protein, partial [Spirulinaceae cyanobacterium RM2_2_10]|nr:redoxin domain-containing protein [Spirulinaceae cyanobacterium RM2_2_10]